MINKYLINNSIFKKEEDELISCNSKYSEIRIKNEKMKILHFSSNKSTALLDKFVSDLKKNSSEYRLLPDSDNMDNNFYSSAFYFDYLGDKSKIRNISDIREDKFGISKFLAKQIFLSLQTDIHNNSNNINELVSFFTSESSIELFSLWEKLYTFIVVDGNSISKIPYLTKGIIFNINKMIKCDNIIDSINLIAECKNYLLISIAMAISLKPSILLDKIIVNNLCSCFNNSNTEFELRRIVNSIRFSNLCRHNYILQPLLNYKRLPDYHDLEGYHDLVSSPHKNQKLEDLDSHLCLFTPRYIKFHEVLLKNIINNVYSNEKSRKNDILKHSFNEYESINKLSGLPLPFNVIDNNESNILRTVDLSKSTTNKTKINIGIVNISTPEKTFKHSYLRNPVLDKYRVKKINNILNQAEIEKVDLLILPEVSIPISLLKTISNFSLKNKIGIIFGLEHIISDDYAYNYIVTLLPVENDGVDSLIVDLRLKNYYSPSEISMLNGYGYKIPVERQPFYNIFKWRGCRFSIFNCFELSNIEHRAKLKSKIDLLIASEYNKDIGYFSNIIESSSRDLHCYVAQVNDSKYGDSRICQPTSSNNKDIVKVKGGDNSVIISSEIDLSSLREFQIKEYSYQILNKEYKPTPPDFNKSSIMDLL
ncbi:MULTISPECIES: hypothetical protein [unclassified Photobacterium]|uniref:hypothetical protein n=1 Tax=unclassified Photobacterium TaxID=2628852 RepID=UPI001EDD599B|nr:MULTISPECIES: hypothetical protein [unclassified Photobacterium]MCG3862638.1 hypothetical protein [Photobacterium sp. Ph6]MCG3874169.1 hypothetical protein [Photobacterium sp. Ph5]